MKLIKPSNIYKESYLRLVKEFDDDEMKTAPFVILWDPSDWPAYIQRLRDSAESGIDQERRPYRLRHKTI